MAPLAFGQPRGGLATLYSVTNAAPQLLAIELPLDQVIGRTQLDGAGIQFGLARSGQKNEGFFNPGPKRTFHQVYVVFVRTATQEIEIMLLLQNLFRRLAAITQPLKVEIGRAAC